MEHSNDVYNRVMRDFCDMYYTDYDNNFYNLRELYTDNSLFTYMEEEAIGFDNYLSIIKNKGIQSFHHFDIRSVAQPVGNRSIIINIFGKLRINKSFIIHNFTETVFIKRNVHDNNYLVYNTIFTTIPKL